VHERTDECEVFQFGPLRLVPARRLLLAGENRIELGSRAFDILALLVRRCGEVVSRRRILEHVWPDLIVDESNLRVQIRALRRALSFGSEGSTHIMNVQGRGYVFIAPVQSISSLETPAASMMIPSIRRDDQRLRSCARLIRTGARNER
jgi:DNA-binding winged helix-turn-helix (wHTH) protein